MTVPFFISSVMVAVLTTFTVTAQATTSSPETIKILLQGSSAQEMRKLVIDHGGTVTHDLPIINAVGARVTADNLEKILESPKIVRYLDDLSISDQPESEPDNEEHNCEVGGALELGIDGNSISWKLYNKRDKPAELNELVMSWPATLGSLESLKLGEQTLPIPKESDSTTQNLTLKFEGEKSLNLSGTANLYANFSGSDISETGGPYEQREFSLEAKFVGDCSAELIPGYEDNANNSYYPGIVGADALHMHGVTGRGVTVAIIDSGLWEHDALRNDLGRSMRRLGQRLIRDGTEERVRQDEEAEKCKSDAGPERDHEAGQAHVAACLEAVQHRPQSLDALWIFS